MTRYLSSEPFSVNLGGGKDWDENWERIFGKKCDDDCAFHDAITPIDGPNAEHEAIDMQAVARARLLDFTEGRETSDIRKQVEEFHHAIGQPVLDYPQVPDDDRVRFRIALILEEVAEFVGACTGVPRDAIKIMSEELMAAIKTAPIHVDLVEVADALADIDYVVEGTRLAFGINGKPLADEVHRSNMAKLGGGQREDGKSLKPEGWTPPNIEAELIKQGMA